MSTQVDKIHIIIMVPSPLTQRWLINFCIDRLAQEYVLEYWDCSAICAIKLNAEEIVNREYVRTIKTLTDMELSLRLLPKDTIMISHIHLEADNYKVHKLITKYNKYRVYFNFWSNSVNNLDLVPKESQICKENNLLFNNKKSVIKEIKNKLYKFRPILYICKYIRFKGDGRFKHWVSLDRQMHLAQKNLALYNYEFVIDVLPHTQFSINHPDYEKYLIASRNELEPLLKTNYIVFLDSYFPFHPHLKIENPNINFEKLVEPYFNSLNSFFDKIEEQYKCEVVISAHPSAKALEHNPFHDRKVFYNKSAELIKDCVGVCMHASYSVSYPILFDKPICLMTNRALRQASNQSVTLGKYSEVFKLPIVDTDIYINKNDLFTYVDKTIRMRYIDLFFDKDNKNPNSELISMHIKKIYKLIAK